MQFVAPIPFEEALRKLGSKTVVTSGFTSSQWHDVPVALRERAFFSSRVESARFLSRAKTSLLDWMSGARETITRPDGTQTTALKTGSRQDFVASLQRFALAEGMGPLKPGDAGTIKDITSQRRLELIFDVQTQQAHDYGNWLQGQDPDVVDEFPAQRFVRVLDVQEPRPHHVQFEDQVRLKSDVHYWRIVNRDFNVPWGPWGWGCGHDVEDVDRAEAESLGLIAPGQKVEPAVQDFNDQLESSARGLPEDLLKTLEDEFGDQVQIDRASMSVRWNPAPGPAQPKPPPPAPSSPPSPVPIPAPLQAPSEIVRQHPVSGAVDITIKAGSKKAVEHALSQIDAVHDDGSLSRLRVTHRVPARAHGAYYRGGREIGVRHRNSTHKELTFAHEVGHWLDEQGLPGAGFSSAQHPNLEAWRQAVRASTAYQNLQTNPGYARRRGYRNYQLDLKEVWARSYAQYVAMKSADKVLLDQIKAVRDGRTRFWVDSQWSDADFSPIALAIDALFRTLRWL